MQKSQTKISFYENNYAERQFNLTSPIILCGKIRQFMKKNIMT